MSMHQAHPHAPVLGLIAGRDPTCLHGLKTNWNNKSGVCCSEHTTS